VRADVCTNRDITLSGVSPDEAEKICLLADILDWQAHAKTVGGDAEGESGVPTAAARLTLRQAGTVIRVETDDPELRRQLARMGLDRLVPPVPLLALEQLLMFAG
jgi:hypothetical protein